MVNSWNFGEEALDPTTVWHGNEHAINVTLDNLETLETDSKEIMNSMVGILHAFEFLEDVLLSEHPDYPNKTASELEAQPPGHSHGHDHHHHGINKRQSDQEGKLSHCGVL